MSLVSGVDRWIEGEKTQCCRREGAIFPKRKRRGEREQHMGFIQEKHYTKSIDLIIGRNWLLQDFQTVELKFLVFGTAGTCMTMQLLFWDRKVPGAVKLSSNERESISALACPLRLGVLNPSCMPEMKHRITAASGMPRAQFQKGWGQSSDRSLGHRREKFSLVREGYLNSGKQELPYSGRRVCVCVKGGWSPLTTNKVELQQATQYPQWRLVLLTSPNSDSPPSPHTHKPCALQEQGYWGRSLSLCNGPLPQETKLDSLLPTPTPSCTRSTDQRVPQSCFSPLK